jgi:hypothetical protein
MNSLKLRKLIKETLEKYKIQEEIKVGDKVSYSNPKTKKTEKGTVSKASKSADDSEMRLTVKMDDGSSFNAPAKQFTKLKENRLREIKESSINIGDIFTLGADLGKFKKGEKVEVVDKYPDLRNRDSINLILYNGKIKDRFTLDKNDDMEDLLNEGAIATDYQFTGQQLDLIKNYGGSLSTGGNALYIPDSLKIQLDRNVKDSKFKQDFYETFEPDRKNLASQLMSGMKKAIEAGSTATMKNKKYFVINGHMTSNGNFNFPNPFREKYDDVSKEKKSSKSKEKKAE